MNKEYLIHNDHDTVYVLNNLKHFIECPIGFHSNDCSKKCIPPTYGEDCQSICSCPKYDCHFARGCLQDVETVTDDQQLSMFDLTFLKLNYINYKNPPELKNKLVYDSYLIIIILFEKFVTFIVSIGNERERCSFQSI